MIDLDELEALARDAGGSSWCLHPNGTSVWTGEQCDLSGQDAAQHMVCKADGWEDIHVRYAMFIADANPAAVLELVQRARRECVVVYDADDSSICSVCGERTEAGHAHQECYASGSQHGAVAENMSCAQQMAKAFGHAYQGEGFAEMLALVLLSSVPLLPRKTIEELIAASSLGTPEAKAIRAAAPEGAVRAVLTRSDQLHEITEHRKK